MKTNQLLAALSISVACPILTYGQTTLSGDHIITGDLNVGTSGAKGNLEVTGETGNSAMPGVKVTGDGGVVFGGTSEVGQIPEEGPGVRFMWYPKKAAIRGGETWDNFDDENIGYGSVGFGYGGFATGYNSFAVNGSNAIGEGSAALGGGVAYGSGAVSLNGLAHGDGSAAISRGITHGISSVALAGGAGLGNYSVGMSYGGAVGYGSTAMSAGAAIGRYSTAMGPDNIVEAFAGVVLGQLNVGGGDPDNWVLTDPVFEIGIGYWDEVSEHRKNALTVFKNGNITIPKRQGDILMGEFGNPE